MAAGKRRAGDQEEESQNQTHPGDVLLLWVLASLALWTLIFGGLSLIL